VARSWRCPSAVEITKRKTTVANFSIGFTGFDDEDPLVAVGTLRLGEQNEYFESVLGFWGTDEYEEIWTAGLRRLIVGASTSCLATSITYPPNTNFVEVWPLYREESDVYVQNHLIFLEQLSHELDPAAPWESVSPRSVVNEDGERISEWRVSIDDIGEFLELGPIRQRPGR
jgi:CdiI N-terminal domain